MRDFNEDGILVVAAASVNRDGILDGSAVGPSQALSDCPLARSLAASRAVYPPDRRLMGVEVESVCLSA